MRNKIAVIIATIAICALVFPSLASQPISVLGTTNTEVNMPEELFGDAHYRTRTNGFNTNLFLSIPMQPYTNCFWTVDDKTPEIALSISTNLNVGWISIEEKNDNTPKQLTVVTYDLIKQVGIIQTNRLLTIIHDGATNMVLLKMLGREEWPRPSQTRTIQVPARYRP